MIPQRLARFVRPPTLHGQFNAALAALAVLIAAGALVAVFALRSEAQATRELAEGRLEHLQQAQDLLLRTQLIEREVHRLLQAPSAVSARNSYTAVNRQLEAIDQLVGTLAAASDNTAVLALHQASQLFRNTTHIVVGLREAELQNTAAAPAPNAGPLPRFNDMLLAQAAALGDAAQALSTDVSLNYRAAVTRVAERSQAKQALVLVLMMCSLALAAVVSHFFVGQQVLARLDRVSQALRDGHTEGGSLEVLVQGDDEIGAMARALELFLRDRAALALANQTLESERQRQQELIRKLADTRTQLLQAEKLASIGQLAAGVAHEINNPVGFVNSNLGTLRGYVADLLRLLVAYEACESELAGPTRETLDDTKSAIDLGYLREDVHKLFQETTDGLQRVKRIVQDLRDFSHVDDGRVQMANLEQGLDSSINIAHAELQKKAEVVREYGNIPEVECNPALLNQVFMNLLVNAAQAISTRGRITVRTGQDAAGVWVEVQDTGSGIAAEHLGRIFDPFFTTKPVGQGTGLGLSLAYGIVQQHHGRIDVRSQLGQGTVFRVNLPLHMPAETQRA